MKKETKIELTSRLIEGALGVFGATVGKGATLESAASHTRADFFAGNEHFLKKPAKNAVWSMGAAQANLTPTDYRTHAYYLGGYLSWDNGFKNLVEEVLDDMQCRCLALSDGSGRGVSVFGTVDCIGITNTDIRRIRRKFTAAFRKRHPEEPIVSVNIFSTHTHSEVDTEGLWTDFPGKLLRNLHRSRTGHGALEQGTDENYMRFLCNRVADALLRAAENRTPGELYLAQKDISSDYFVNKNRPSATSVVTDLTRLTFLPADKSMRPIMIVNLPAHPDVAGLPTSDGSGTGRVLSGDYVHYMGDIINRAGYDFMFFNGAICAIYMARGASNDGLRFSHRYEQSVRFGREVGRIALSLSKTLPEIQKDTLLFDEKEIAADTAESEKNGEVYTLWCDGWEPVAEKKLPALFNIRLREVKIPVTNPIMIAAGKLRLVHHTVLTEGKKKYFLVTEIGYAEFGNTLKAAMVPGEFCCDLLSGGDSLTTSGSISKQPFGLPSVRALFGADTICFGLANDAIGYIVPDNDYTMGDPANHYHELVSLGKYAGSSIIDGFVKLHQGKEDEG